MVIQKVCFHEQMVSQAIIFCEQNGPIQVMFSKAHAFAPKTAKHGHLGLCIFLILFKVPPSLEDIAFYYSSYVYNIKSQWVGE